MCGILATAGAIAEDLDLVSVGGAVLCGGDLEGGENSIRWRAPGTIEDTWKLRTGCDPSVFVESGFGHLGKLQCTPVDVKVQHLQMCREAADENVLTHVRFQRQQSWTVSKDRPAMLNRPRTELSRVDLNRHCEPLSERMESSCFRHAQSLSNPRYHKLQSTVSGKGVAYGLYSTAFGFLYLQYTKFQSRTCIFRSTNLPVGQGLVAIGCCQP